MQRIVNIAKTREEAEEWDILQQINMTSSESCQRTKNQILWKKS